MRRAPARRPRAAAVRAAAAVARPASSSVTGHGGRVPNFINGEFAQSSAQDFVENLNPATQEVISLVPESTAAEMRACIDGAVAAQRQWRRTPPQARARVMFRVKELMEQEKDALARCVSLEHGKTLADAAGDVFRGLEVVEMACSIPTILQGEHLAGVARDFTTSSVREPLGVIGAITPFNYPVMIPLWMMPVALGCGNALVMKPHKADPGPVMMLADIFQRAGLPDGLLQIFHGSRRGVRALCAAPEVQAVTFVGSTPAANDIYRQCAEGGKRVQLNGGAKNHVVMMPDMDRKAAVAAVVAGAFGGCGQRCMAIAHLVMVGKEAEVVIPDIVAAARSLRVSGGQEPGADMGPLVSREAKQRVVSIIDSAERDGATIELDGRGISVSGFEEGNFVGPTVISGVTQGMACYTEETFGPVITISSAPDLGAALAFTNACPFGNGAVIFTGSGAAAARFVDEVEAGMVGVNVPVPVPTPQFSFSGWKDSMRGDLHFLGKQGVQFYTRTKLVSQFWDNAGRA